MEEDLIIYDAEINTAVREIKEYIEFLITKVVDYNRCLKHVQEKGIEDEIIRAKLKNLSTLLLDYVNELKTIHMALDCEFRMFQVAVDLGDTFQFPSDDMADLIAVIKSFI